MVFGSGFWKSEYWFSLTLLLFPVDVSEQVRCTGYAQ